MIHYVKLIRPQQWIKNLFIFIPPFFAGVLFNSKTLIEGTIGLISFSLVASAVYILNDLKDIEVDRAHPAKKYRPLASSRISKQAAIALLALFSLTGLGIGFWLNEEFGYVITGYFLLNIGYCFGLKKVAILDMLIVALGFVLRTIAGGFIAEVAISQWLLIMIFLLSFFLAIAKRRDDILLQETSGVSVRKSTEKYNLDFINAAMTMISTIMIMAYIMYTISEEVIERIGFEHLYLTSIFVLSGIMRYLQMALVENKTSSPVRILYTDRFIQSVLVLWVLSFIFIIYWHA